MFEFETIEMIGEIGKMLVDMMMVKRQTQQTKQRHRNDVRIKIKGNEVVKKSKKMAVTVKDLSIKTWWRSLVTFCRVSLVGATCDTL